MAGKVSVPVAIHLDHGDSFERCMEMLKLGFTTIGADGSAPPVEENGGFAHRGSGQRCAGRFGVPLAAEIGELCRLDDGETR
ncbi:MAG: class II fructose-bisphosphate aldolase [Enterocloster bolteae]